MIVVEPCAYKAGTRKYAEKICDALKSQEKLEQTFLLKDYPKSKLIFILSFVILYFKIWVKSNRTKCAVLFLSVEPTTFPIINFLFPIKNECYVKIGGYEFRNSNNNSFKNLLVWVRIKLWRLIPKVVKITETQNVADRLKQYCIENIKKYHHPVDNLNRNRSFDPNIQLKTLLYFGHRPPGDKNTLLILELARKRKDYSICIAGYEEDRSVHRSIKSYIHAHQLVNVNYENRVITEMEKNKLFKECKYVLLPYKKMYDGGSGVLFDALKYGRQVVASNVGEFKHLLQDTSLGITFKADNLQSLIKALQTLEKHKTPVDRFKLERKALLRERSFESFVTKLLEEPICQE